jgi:hypothetical protein
MDKTIDNIHPNAPKRLAALWHKVLSDRKVAELRGVNHFYVSQLLWRGIEPDDKTEHQKEIRAKLYLRRRKPKRRRPKVWNRQQSIIEAMSNMTKQALRWKKRKARGD